MTDVSKVVWLYALISEVRVLSARDTVESADEVARQNILPLRTKDANIICSAVEDWARLWDSSQPGGLLFR